MTWFEDIAIGAHKELGNYTFTQEEIIAFAMKYDPQPIHTDPEAGKRSAYGSIIASGLHTASTWMKLVIASRAKPEQSGEMLRSGVSPGFRDLKWSKPVKPGTTLRFSTTVIEKIELKSKPQWGLVRSRNEAIDETGDVAMSFIGQGFVARKPQT